MVAVVVGAVAAAGAAGVATQDEAHAQQSTAGGRTISADQIHQHNDRCQANVDAYNAHYQLAL